MKFTLFWLKEHLETDAPLDAIVDKLTMIGLEVERVENRGLALAWCCASARPLAASTCRSPT